MQSLTLSTIFLHILCKKAQISWSTWIDPLLVHFKNWCSSNGSPPEKIQLPKISLWSINNIVKASLLKLLKTSEVAWCYKSGALNQILIWHRIEGLIKDLHLYSIFFEKKFFKKIFLSIIKDNRSWWSFFINIHVLAASSAS